MKYLRCVCRTSLAFLFLLLYSSISFADAGLTYHGRIFKPDGTPLESTAVLFTIQIRSPGNESCLLFQESQTLNMSDSGGAFSLEVGANPSFRVASAIDGGYSISRIFANQGTFNLPTCNFGSTYTPNTADGRLLYVTFDDGSGQQSLSAQKITYVPFAVEAMQLSGYGASQLLRVDSGAAPVLTPANLTTLSELFTGTLSINTSGNVVSSGTVSGSDVHANSIRVYNGTNYVELAAPNLTGNVQFKLPAADGSANQILKTDGTGNLSWTNASAGNVTSVAVTSPLTNSGTATAPNIGLSTGSDAGQVLRYDGATQWVPAFLRLADIRSTVSPFGGAFATANCTATESLYYDSLSDTFKCQEIALTSADLPTTGATGVYTNGGNTFGVNANLGTTDAFPLLFITNNTSRMIITDTGQIGIGNSSPATLLHITEKDDSWASSFRMDRSWDSTTDYFQMMYDYEGLKIQTANDADGDGTDIIFKPKGSEALRLTEVGRVGIGTSTPQTQLHVANTDDAVYLRVKGISDGDAYASLDLDSDEATDKRWEISHGAGSYNNQLNFKFFANPGWSFPLNLTSDGKVGIGTTSPGYTLDVDGTTANVSGAWVLRSDERLKRDIATLENSLQTVLGLHGVSFRWKDQELNKKFGLQRGFIAQEVEKIVPEWVHEGPDGFKRIEKNGIEAYLVEALKELYSKWFSDHERVRALEERSLRLEAQNQELKQVLCEIQPASRICSH